MAEEKETETIKKKQSKEKDGNEKEKELFENIQRIVKEICPSYAECAEKCKNDSEGKEGDKKKKKERKK